MRWPLKSLWTKTQSLSLILRKFHCGRTSRRLWPYGKKNYRGHLWRPWSPRRRSFFWKRPYQSGSIGSLYGSPCGKNIVAANLCERCLVQLAYAIGVSQPVSIFIEDFGTSKHSPEALKKAVTELWNLALRVSLKA